VEQVQRNDPCSCGSGKKYKKCCMNLDKANYLLGGFSFKGKSVYFVLIALFFLSIFLRAYGFQQTHKFTFDEAGRANDKTRRIPIIKNNFQIICKDLTSSQSKAIAAQISAICIPT